MDNNYVLKMEGITKEYFGNKVLKGVDLKVRPGEIHALMGENGAGKSTLMNILFGMPVIHTTGGFGGTIEFNGQPVKIDNPLRVFHHHIELCSGLLRSDCFFPETVVIFSANIPAYFTDGVFSINGNFDIHNEIHL